MHHFARSSNPPLLQICTTVFALKNLILRGSTLPTKLSKNVAMDSSADGPRHAAWNLISSRLAFVFDQIAVELLNLNLWWEVYALTSDYSNKQPANHLLFF